MRRRWPAAVSVLALVGAGVAWALVSGGAPGDADGGERRAGRAGTVAGGGGGPAVSWTWSVTVDSGAGTVGPWRMNRSDWRYVDDPTVAVGPGSGAAVAWVDQEEKDVFFQRWAPDGEPALAAPVDVSRSPGVFSWLPRAVVSPGSGNRVYLLWQEIVFSGGTHGGEAFFARSADGGRTFSEPVNLSNTEAGVGKGRLAPRRWHNGSLDLAAAPGGRVYAAWTAYEGGLWVARSGDGGRTFSESVRITGGGRAEPARGPSLAPGPDGVVHLAWAVGGTPTADLRYAVSHDGGRSFGATGVLFESPARADAPSLAVDGGGTLHLAWEASPAGRIGDHRVRYARRPAGQDGFESPRTLVTPDGPAIAGVRYPALELDGSGDPHLLWELVPRGGGRTRGLGFTASSDGGKTFGDAVLVPGTVDPRFSVNGSLQGMLMDKLAVGDEGGVAVVNSGFEPGEASRVGLVRGRVVER